MKKNIKIFLAMFTLTTLFLCGIHHQVYAVTAQDLISTYEIRRYESSSIGSNNQPLYSYEAIVLPIDKSQIYDETTGTLQIVGNQTTNGFQTTTDYIFFSITYKINGETITEEPTVGFSDDGECILRISQEIPEGSPYQLHITERKETVETIDEDHKSLIDSSEETFDTPLQEFHAASTQIDDPSRTTWLSAGWDLLHGDLSGIGKILVETFCDIITPAGDAYLDMICNAVGEVVTIDRVVYNRVSKVDIDFFTDSQNDANTAGSMGLSTPLKSIMGKVVDKLYVFFRNIVIVIYLVMLVYIGIKILLTSTAEKKASYKSIFMAWVMGTAMLFFFPYVIKYTIKVNGALCRMIEGAGNGRVAISNYKAVNELSTTKYGTDRFVDHMVNGGNVADDAMMNVRYIGAKYWNLPLLIVYFIFIGQLTAILIMYYKRVFMIAFLIAIFPVVVAIYPLNKIGDIRMNPFGEWLREFVVNVFVQSFHAATYKVIVTIGVASYIGGGGNWLFLIICVLFLFEGEKLIRAIFNAKSSANTIGNMAMAGALAMKVMKSAGSAIPTANKKKDEESDDDKMAKEKARKDLAAQSSRGANSNQQAVNSITESGDAKDASSSKAGTGSTGATTPISASTTVLSSNALSTSDTSESSGTGTGHVDYQMEQKKKENKPGKGTQIASSILGNTFSFGTQLTGGIVGTTYGMAQNNANQGMSAAATGFASGIGTGKAIGKSGKQFLQNRIDKRSTRKAAALLAAEYEAGEHDDEIGINEADRQLNNERAQAIRKAHAEYIRRSTGWRGKTGAQLEFYKAQMKILNESLDRNKD